MSRPDETLVAATAILRGLAKGTTTQSPQTNGLKLPPYSLPGEDTPSKDEFEAEIAALARRINYLESRADVVGRSLPDTPGESQNPASPGSRPFEPRNPLGGSYTDPTIATSDRAAFIPNQPKRSNSNLAQTTVVSEDEIGILKDHVEKQAQQIRSQRETIAEISRGLRSSEEQAKQAFMRVENEDVSMLERELRKHQQANEAFQKALREIGGIITQVANGDLSKRVQIQATEMDDEIAAFKVTINTMMDQLEIFGSEVTRVAREVGTEGILGGQAQISGVHGIWKELTDNGIHGPAFLSELMLTEL
jgi:osomolarity two-component system sensor histidine kinase NIK1